MIRSLDFDVHPVDLGEFTKPLNAAVDTLDELTAWLLDRAQNNPNEIGAASVEYLHVFGYTAYAYMWARMAQAVLSSDVEDDFHTSKLATARAWEYWSIDLGTSDGG